MPQHLFYADNTMNTVNKPKLFAKNDFSSGPVWKVILIQSVPLILAQLVHLMYNVVDRIYIGHMGEDGSLALTGIGLTFPVVTLIMGFAALFGNGGVPLFSIARGEGNSEKSGIILGNSFSLIVISSVALTVLCFIFKKPVLYAFGASDDSYVYAKDYLTVYLFGTVFSMLATGLNGYISAQGFPQTGMLSTVIGALVNILLDPVFIFALRLGVSGAAAATVISQAVSCLFVLRFLTGKKAEIPLKAANTALRKSTVSAIVKLGISNFVMQGTACVVQITCNATLQTYGGDLFVGIMTVVNSIREIFMLPVNGLIGGSQPVISYNYGARNYGRVRQGINFNTFFGAGYTLFAWALVYFFPKLWFSVFLEDEQMIETGIEMLKIYFFGFVFMSFQFAGQSTFQALGDAGHAIFFSLLRKLIIVVPLTLILPYIGFGVKGVFYAEPISNIIGGLACFITMRMTVFRKLSVNGPENQKQL